MWDFGGAPWEAQVLDLDERDLPTESTWDLASSLARSGGDSGVGDAGGSDWVFTGGGESDGDDDDGGVASEGGGLMRAAMQQRPADHGDGDGDGAGDGERAPMRAAKRARPANPVRRAAPVEPAVDPAGTSTSTTNGPYSSVDATPAVPMVAAVAPARSAPAPAPAPAPPPAPAPADAAPARGDVVQRRHLQYVEIHEGGEGAGGSGEGGGEGKEKGKERGKWRWKRRWSAALT